MSQHEHLEVKQTLPCSHCDEDAGLIYTHCAGCGSQYSGIPRGYVLVPEEPTEKMVRAAAGTEKYACIARTVYKAMISAAQEEVPTFRCYECDRLTTKLVWRSRCLKCAVKRLEYLTEQEEE